MSEKRAYVIMPNDFPKFIGRFLDALKEQDIIEEYRVNKAERRIIITFTEQSTDGALSNRIKATSPITKEDFLVNGFFANYSKVAKDILAEEGDEDYEQYLISMPMYATEYKKDTVPESMNIIINY